MVAQFPRAGTVRLLVVAALCGSRQQSGSKSVTPLCLRMFRHLGFGAGLALGLVALFRLRAGVRWRGSGNPQRNYPIALHRRAAFDGDVFLPTMFCCRVGIGRSGHRIFFPRAARTWMGRG